MKRDITISLDRGTRYASHKNYAFKKRIEQDEQLDGGYVEHVEGDSYPLRVRFKDLAIGAAFVHCGELYFRASKSTAVSPTVAEPTTFKKKAAVEPARIEVLVFPLTLDDEDAVGEYREVSWSLLKKKAFDAACLDGCQVGESFETKLATFWQREVNAANVDGQKVRLLIMESA